MLKILEILWIQMKYDFAMLGQQVCSLVFKQNAVKIVCIRIITRQRVEFNFTVPSSTSADE